MSKACEYNERNLIYVLKAFCVVSIISAHCGSVGVEGSNISKMFSRWLGTFGAVGVGIFFMISGYLFWNNKRRFKEFLKAKYVAIIIPWCICGSAVYLYVTLRKGGLSIWGWMNWILGNGTYLYYLTVLIFFYIVFYKLKYKNFILIGSIIISIFSQLGTSLGWIYGINPYLNPFNWMIFFAAGLLIHKYELLEKISVKCQKLFLPISVVGIMIFASIAIFKQGIGYQSLTYIPFEFFMGVFLIGMSMLLINSQRLIWVGKESFSIYLLHMPFAGLITNIFNKINIGITVPLRPIIVLIITIMCIKIYKVIIRKCRFEKIGNILIGSR